MEDLERKSTDPASSTVTRNKAAAELAQLKQENPLPLRRAKITQEAALRKVEKERKAAEAATAAATAAAETAAEKARDADAKAAEAEATRVELEEQTAKVEAAVVETEEKYREASEYLEELKKKGGVAFGAIWWMERELKEAQKYMPKKKQTQT